MNAKGGYVYIMSNYNRTVFYIGVTYNLSARSYEHKHGLGGGMFTKKYKCLYLVYYEFFESIEREKKLKKWKRAYKIALIEGPYPNMYDLYNEVRELV